MIHLYNLLEIPRDPEVSHDPYHLFSQKGRRKANIAFLSFHLPRVPKVPTPGDAPVSHGAMSVSLRTKLKLLSCLGAPFCGVGKRKGRGCVAHSAVSNQENDQKVHSEKKREDASTIFFRNRFSPLYKSLQNRTKITVAHFNRTTKHTEDSNLFPLSLSPSQNDSSVEISGRCELVGHHYHIRHSGNCHRRLGLRGDPRSPPLRSHLCPRPRRGSSLRLAPPPLHQQNRHFAPYASASCSAGCSGQQRPQEECPQGPPEAHLHLRVRSKILLIWVRDLLVRVRPGRGDPRASSVQSRLPRGLHRDVAGLPLLLSVLPSDPGGRQVSQMRWTSSRWQIKGATRRLLALALPEAPNKI